MSRFKRRTPPLCKCGCGGFVKKYRRRWNKYISGHQTRGYKHSKEVCKLRSERMKGNKNPSKRLKVRKKMSEAKKGKYTMEKSPSWKGGVYVNKQGRTIVSIGNGNEIAKARLIAEKALGRPLKSSELVHHIDEDKRNDNNNNLLICNHAYHLFLHRKMNPDNYKCFNKQSEETKEKRAKKIRRPVMVDGRIFSSMKEAVEKSNWCFLTIRKRIFNKVDGYMYLERGI